MLVQITALPTDPALTELMEFATRFNADLEEKAWELYFTKGKGHAELYAFQEDEKWIGLIGCTMIGEDQLDILHLAVRPEERSMGYGREIIIEALLLKKPQIVRAETDDEGADFFRNIGFRVNGFIPPSGGAEYFLCEYDVEEDSEE